MKMSLSEEDVVLSSIKAVFSENQFDTNRHRKQMTQSFAGYFPETSPFDVECVKCDAKKIELLLL